MLLPMATMARDHAGPNRCLSSLTYIWVSQSLFSLASIREMYFLGLGKGEIVTRSHCLPICQASPRSKEPIFKRVFFFPTFKTISEKKEEGTKDGASVATSSSQRAVIMQNPLKLVTFQLLPFCLPCQDTFVFLSPKFYGVFSFGLIFALFFILDYIKPSFRGEMIQFDVYMNNINV